MMFKTASEVEMTIAEVSEAVTEYFNKRITSPSVVKASLQVAASVVALKFRVEPVVKEKDRIAERDIPAHY